MANPALAAGVPADPLAWAAPAMETRPWSYWWWMGSAVDPDNIRRELTRYQQAGLGGAHIIPIYGAKGFEPRYVQYLSPQWMQMLRHSVEQAGQLGMGIDMTTGTGWCFGGPNVSERDACAEAVIRTYEVKRGERLSERFERAALHALYGFSDGAAHVDLLGRLRADGTLDWSPESGAWTVYAVSQRPCRVRVKRAAPGGEGHMLNPFLEGAIERYLERFAAAFASYNGPKPRAMYHDSFEYGVNWSPEFFAEFEKRRGYKLEGELPLLFGKQSSERAARVKSDYRETAADLLAGHFLPGWVQWSRRNGFLTRNQAHGSPGNLLDLYGGADIPETEMFHQDRNTMLSKFASSAAHVMGRRLTSSETGTWLKEHFTETLADMKVLVDQLFLAGVNHVIYHGTIYSPDDAPWPGWLFYASTQMNPRNSIWRDAPALNAYITRSQSVLQSGQPDNDILLYWPIYDLWHNPEGLNMNLTVHNRRWFEEQAIGRLAGELWRRGLTFDYVSDRQLQNAKVRQGSILVPGGEYRVVLSPPASKMPLATLEKLLALARGSATVIFADKMPEDVPGLGRLEDRRDSFRMLLSGVRLTAAAGGYREARLGDGHVLVGEVEAALAGAGVRREPMTDHAGLEFIRRALPQGEGWYYFIANRGSESFDGWIALAKPAPSVVLLDPMSGRTGVGAVRRTSDGPLEVRLQLAAGHSIVLRTSAMPVQGAAWDYGRATGSAVELKTSWRVRFLEGGPELPPPFETAQLGSWTSASDAAERFAGTALYTASFDAPGNVKRWLLDLGEVRESARVRVNGKDLGTLIMPPHRVVVDGLKPSGNVLEVEVTNLSANRIRDLDRRKVVWRKFHDINLVNINYKPFDASAWPVRGSGLLGPVRLQAYE